MTHRIESIDLFVRETPPARMGFALGRRSGSSPHPTASRQPRFLGHVRLMVGNGARRAFGCSADGLSVRWLDKRPDRPEALKLRELVGLIRRARDIYLESPEFDSPFEKWQRCHPQIMQAGREAGQEDLTSSFASALMERALLDAFARLHEKPLFEMIQQDRIGFRPDSVHPELKEFAYLGHLPVRPLTRFHIRHTVGQTDPLTANDLQPGERVNDGEPETLEEYIRRDGISYFKVKISGDPDWDVGRLARLWETIPRQSDAVITLDANEAYQDLAIFETFVRRLEKDHLGLFQHILYIEQPLSRELTHDPSVENRIRRIGRSKPVIIDESDGAIHSFKEAFRLGYQGTSHKNCKGFFKSLLNFCLIAFHSMRGQPLFLSGEDLSNLPIVPLHQDFAALGVLNLDHCERNGHHYLYGLSMLTEKEKESVSRYHTDLYEKRGSEWFLKIRRGTVECASLQCPGFGVKDEPDWQSMIDMQEWLRRRDPTGGA